MNLSSGLFIVFTPMVTPVYQAFEGCLFMKKSPILAVKIKQGYIVLKTHLDEKR
jgi:hypothetical protein